MSVDRPRISLGGSSDVSAPLSLILSVVGLLVIAIVSLGLITGNLPGFGGGGGGGGPAKTPTPSNVVNVDPRSRVPGSIVYAKAGNIWLQSGDTAHQITSGGTDSMPAWTPDGTHIYFVRTTTSKDGNWPADGALHRYYLQTPSLMRMEARVGATPEEVLNGRITRGTLVWHYILREPAISPDGKLAAVVSDGPDPEKSDVVLKFVDLANPALTSAGTLSQTPPLGHQDPTWSPDGRYVYYVKNARNGSKGAPVIQRYDTTTKKVTAIGGPGYLAPSVSPDGAHLAVTRTDSFGTDVAILDARTGTELLRITHDGTSFSPVWSPAGDSIAFLRIDFGVVDLELVKLSGSAPSWTVGQPLALTVSAGLDPGSRPAWFIPASELPKPTATPVTSIGVPTLPASAAP